LRNISNSVNRSDRRLSHSALFVGREMIETANVKGVHYGPVRAMFPAFACLLAVFVTVAYGEPIRRPTPIASNGHTIIAASSHEVKVEVEVRTHEAQIGKPSDKRPDIVTSSCTYSRYPCSIVDLIDITVNGKPIIVPRSVFSDLADLNDGEIRIGRKESVLTITGGDASESYIAKIRFNSKRVTGLYLFDGESGKKLQETTYYQVVVDDEGE